MCDLCAWGDNLHLSIAAKEHATPRTRDARREDDAGAKCFTITTAYRAYSSLHIIARELLLETKHQRARRSLYSSLQPQEKVSSSTNWQQVVLRTAVPQVTLRLVTLVCSVVLLYIRNWLCTELKEELSNSTEKYVVSLLSSSWMFC